LPRIVYGLRFNNQACFLDVSGDLENEEASKYFPIRALPSSVPHPLRIRSVELPAFIPQFGYNPHVENETRLGIDPVVEAYKKHVDRTLLRKNLKLTIEERLLQLARLHEFAEELRRSRCAARKAP
jgi:hypothetical protein